ncbi:nitroreductase family protein [Pelosinus propionicus]|uniref:nitroreductase family protein n=1 Tax=Pelosinus propionicus TaxID=380084 RepID=UPI000A71D32B|nr:nitroreductase family protein [Pelosinus propionicus]
MRRYGYNIISHIVNRRSIRSYTSKKVSTSDITEILTAANCAPSGNNLQPWKFSVVINDEQLLKKLASLTILGTNGSLLDSSLPR